MLCVNKTGKDAAYITGFMVNFPFLLFGVLQKPTNEMNNIVDLLPVNFQPLGA